MRCTTAVLPSRSGLGVTNVTVSIAVATVSSTLPSTESLLPRCALAAVDRHTFNTAGLPATRKRKPCGPCVVAYQMRSSAACGATIWLLLRLGRMAPLDIGVTHRPVGFADGPAHLPADWIC